jgi:hypothetical protein
MSKINDHQPHLVTNEHNTDVFKKDSDEHF